MEKYIKLFWTNNHNICAINQSINQLINKPINQSIYLDKRLLGTFPLWMVKNIMWLTYDAEDEHHKVEDVPAAGEVVMPEPNELQNELNGVDDEKD